MSQTSTAVGTPVAAAPRRVLAAFPHLRTRLTEQGASQAQLLSAFVAVGLLAVAALAFVGIVRVPVFVDEADNIETACLMSRGSVVYRDVFSHHFPAPYLALAALREPAACSVLAGRILGMVSLTLAAGVFAFTARNILAPLALLVLALTAPLYYTQLYLAETFMCLGLILALPLLTDRGRQVRGPLGFGLRVLAVAVLSSSSPLGAMMAAVLLPLMVLGSGRPYWPVIGACVAGLLVWPLALAVQGALPAFIDQGIVFNTSIYGQYLPVQLTNPFSLLWATLN
ncbi:MAG: hypothetical protein AB7K36_29965, partial [Chloroflexota bacterium]